MSNEALYSDEARKKLTEIVDEVKLAMFATRLGSKPFGVVPMHSKRVDDDGDIWFLSPADSDHNADIEADSQVQLLYAGGSHTQVLSVYGQAEIVTDREMIRQLYSGGDNAWFDGEDDPRVTAIRVTPKEAVYWDNDESSLVTMFKLARAAVTGKDQDIGTQGHMRMN